MKTNIGKFDRIMRVVAGAALGVAAWNATGLAAAVLGAAAAGAMLTGFLGWCGVYALLGSRTCRVDD